MCGMIRAKLRELKWEQGDSDPNLENFIHQMNISPAGTFADLHDFKSFMVTWGFPHLKGQQYDCVWKKIMLDLKVSIITQSMALIPIEKLKESIAKYKASPSANKHLDLNLLLFWAFGSQAALLL